MKTIAWRRLWMAGCCGLAAWGSAAAAQAASGQTPDGAVAAPNPLEEIVVTARRRAENLQTTPVAITAISSETLEARNVISL
jgi:iron complex outermembrane receptor protein